MKYLLTTLCFGILVSSGFSQTMKSLMYNTNGVVTYNNANPLTFTNAVTFSNIQDASSVYKLDLSQGSFIYETNIVASWIGNAFAFAVPIEFFNNAEATTRTNLGVAAAPIFKVLTNDFSITNQTNLVTVDGLTLPTEAGKHYVVELLFILGHEAQSSQAKIDATNATVYGNWDSFGTGGFTTNRLTNAHAFGHAATDARAFVQTFYVEAVTNSGSVSLSVASTVATNTNTIGVGSYMMAQEVVPTP